MKKFLGIILVVTIAFTLIACGQKQTEAETAPEKDSAAGMPNPMVEINDPAEFEKQLGIAIDPSQITSDTKLFIIDKNLAHIAWTQKNVNNEDVDFALRATKDPELGPVCHGIQGDLKKLNEIEINGNDGPVTMTCFEQGNYTIYTWKNGDVFYSLTYDKSMSQMAMAEILDQVMFATGIMTPVRTVFPIPTTVDLENIADGVYPVFVDDDGIYEENGKYYMDCEVSTVEYFDAEDMHSLKPGDEIVIGGDNYSEIKTVEEKDKRIVINGGDPDNGGIEFRLTDAGNYVFVDFDDYPSYTVHGMTTLEIADDAVLTDTSDLDKRCEKIIVTGPKEIKEHLASSEFARLMPGAGNIRTENKKVVEMETWYVP